MTKLTNLTAKWLDNQYFSDGLEVVSINLDNAYWQSIDAPWSNFSYSQGVGVNINTLNCPSSNFTLTVLDYSYLDNINLSYSRFYHCKFNSTRFISCNFYDAELSGVTFSNCIFQHCDFSDTVSNGTNFINCKFNDCKNYQHLLKNDNDNVSPNNDNDDFFVESLTALFGCLISMGWLLVLL